MKLIFHFAVKEETALLGLTLYLVGLSLAPVLGAPLSEKFGRKGIYVCMLPATMAFIGGTIAAKNFKTVLACRFFTALFGSPVLAIAAGTIVDLWDLDMLVVAMTVFSLAPFDGSYYGSDYRGLHCPRFQNKMESNILHSAWFQPFSCSIGITHA